MANAKIISPSPKGPTAERAEIVDMTSERALNEFRVACEIWLPYMNPEDRAKAIAAVSAARPTRPAGAQ